MKNRIIALCAVLLSGILLLIVAMVNVGPSVLAKGDEEFRISGSTLMSYLGEDEFVSVPDTVKVIGEGAFAGNTTLQSVELPDGVESIRYNAFGDCTALEGITIPDSVTKVSPGAFKGCTALESVEIGENVSSWGSGVFNGCSSLNELFVDEDNMYLTYYNGALYNGDMSMLYQVLGGREGENYVMPSEVKEMDAYAFWDLQNTKNVMISDAVTSIPSYSMSSMGSVENVILPDSITEIAERAFANNDSLKQVMIPDTVKTIHDKAFANSPNVKLLVTEGSKAESFGEKNGIEVIYEAEYPTDFLNSNDRMEVKPSFGVTDDSRDEEEEGAKENEADVQIYYPGVSDVDDDALIGSTIIVGGKAVVLMNNTKQKVYGTPAVLEEETQEEFETEDELELLEKEIIKAKQFYRQAQLTEYEISNAVTYIGTLAFSRSGLQEIVIPKSVTTIEYGAFYACLDLAEVEIPKSVTAIGSKAFEGTKWLNDWFAAEEEEFLVVGDGILIAYNGDAESVEIPNGVKQIGPDVFKDHTELRAITIPKSVTRIGANAFYDCKGLSEVKGCEGLETITKGAFNGTQISEADFMDYWG